MELRGHHVRPPHRVPPRTARSPGHTPRMCVAIEWLRIDEPRNAARRYVMSAATYSRLVDAVK